MAAFCAPVYCLPSLIYTCRVWANGCRAWAKWAVSFFHRRVFSMSVHRCLYFSLTLVMIAAWTTHSSASIVTGQTVGFDFGSIAPAANPTQTFNQIDLFNNSLANGATFTFLTDPNLNGGATSTQLVDFTNTAVTGVGFTITNSTGQNTSRANVTNGTAGPAPCLLYTSPSPRD